MDKRIALPNPRSGKQEQREAPSSTCTIVLVSQTGHLFRLVCKGVKRENTLELQEDGSNGSLLLSLWFESNTHARSAVGLYEASISIHQRPGGF